MAIIPLVDLNAQYEKIRPDIRQALDGVLSRADFIHGADTVKFEHEFAEYCGAKEAVGVSSGTSALHLALLACGIQPGDEVITTPFTFIATAEAISHAGARPVFADISPVTYNIDPASIERSITHRTRAIIPVHLYGRPADMDAISAIASRYDLKVIEDAAQAHGATYRGRQVGTLGAAACFSFYPGKNLGAYGDAGAIVTDDHALAESVRRLRDHGRKEKYEHREVGFGARLDTIQAAVLRVKLKHIREWTERRREIAEQYRRILEYVEVQLPPQDEYEESVYHLFVIRSPVRDRLRASLGEMGISTGIHYPIPLHLQPAYQALGYSSGDFPHSERAAAEVLSLPIYPEMNDKQVSTVAEAVASLIGESRVEAHAAA